MPQVEELCSTVQGGRHNIINRPGCATRIAAILSEWAMVETCLANLLAATMGSHTEHGKGGLSISGDRNSLIIMGEIDSIHMRLRIVDSLLGPYLTLTLRADWEALKRKIRGGAKQRNLCAHAAWLFNETFPDDLLLMAETRQNMLRYEVKDFDEILDRIQEVYGETTLFQHKVLAAMRAGNVRI